MLKIYICLLILSISNLANSKDSNHYLDSIDPLWKWSRVCPSDKTPCFSGKYKKTNITAFMAAHYAPKATLTSLCDNHIKALKKSQKIDEFIQHNNYCYWKASGELHYMVLRKEFINIFKFSTLEGHLDLAMLSSFVAKVGEK